MPPSPPAPSDCARRDSWRDSHLSRHMGATYGGTCQPSNLRNQPGMCQSVHKTREETCTPGTARLPIRLPHIVPHNVAAEVRVLTIQRYSEGVPQHPGACSQQVQCDKGNNIRRRQKRKAAGKGALTA